jgi:hypothetical protein
VNDQEVVASTRWQVAAEPNEETDKNQMIFGLEKNQKQNNHWLPCFRPPFGDSKITVRCCFRQKKYRGELFTSITTNYYNERRSDKYRN